ncbi:MAG: hypothetical protein WCU00_00775 [Candidatus Latescibacterota bacterium]
MDRRNAIKSIPLAAAAGLICKTVKADSYSEDKKSLGLIYLEKVREMLQSIKERETDKLLESAYHVAQTIKSGGSCYNQWDMGHSLDFDLFPERPGDPGLFINGYTGVQGKKGDTLLLSMVGSVGARGPMDDPHKRGIFVIGAPAPWSAETPHPELLTEEQQVLKYRHFCDIWIDTGISTEGAIMEIPGENVHMGPVSGALGIMTFWMITADAVRILAREGIPVKVKGDEPGLKKENYAPYSYAPRYNKPINVDNPLGREYFDEAMRQLRSIESEFGMVNRIAGMVVDTILTGGKVLNYSRYRNSLCVEAINRRGGLLLNRGLFNGEKGLEAIRERPGDNPKAPPASEKDIVIMGIYQPDDPVDIKNLHEIRKYGAKIVSIGAASKDGAIPSGETVPSLSDAHLGMMSNTWGLFAVPGVNRKVCPTSGLLLNQMFYAVQMQIAEKIRERTGNNPRIDANAAMKGGLAKRKLDWEIIRGRGY